MTPIGRRADTSVRPYVLVALAFTLGLCPAARAREMWSSTDGAWAWDVGGFVKSQTLGLDYGGLDAWKLLAGADRAAEQTLRARLGSDLAWGDARLVVEGEARALLDTRGWLSQASATGFGATTARPRLWDPEPWGGDGVTVQPDLDRAFVGVALGPVDLTLGRQAVSWGSAWFWKPTDRFGPFSPTDVDPDVKRGVDAARAQVYLGPDTSLDLLATFERHPGTDRSFWAHGGARLRSTFEAFDVAVSLARFQGSAEGDWMAGAEVSGALGDVGLRGEVAVNVGEDSRRVDVEAVLGADYRLPIDLHLAAEAFYNGYGAAHADEYAAFLLDPARSERLTRGESFALGRYYAGLTADQQLHPLVHLVVGALGNLGDPSTLLMAGLRWAVLQDARLSLGALVPVGRRPEGLAARSEYGSMPLAGYGVLKVSF